VVRLVTWLCSCALDFDVLAILRAKGRSNCKNFAPTKGTGIDAGGSVDFFPPFPLAATCGGLVGITQHLVTGGRPYFLRARRAGGTKTTMPSDSHYRHHPADRDRPAWVPALDQERAWPAGSHGMAPVSPPTWSTGCRLLWATSPRNSPTSSSSS
jgi:hypothetical protein